MLWRLFLLFTLLPAVELFLLVRIGQWVGVVPTVVGVLAMGALGAALARREGLGLLRQLQADLQAGLPPADRLVEGAMVLVGCILLVTPGVVTDVIGFACLLPPTRRVLLPLVKRQAGKWIHVRSWPASAPAATRPPPEAPTRRFPFDHPAA